MLLQGCGSEEPAGDLVSAPGSCSMCQLASGHPSRAASPLAQLELACPPQLTRPLQRCLICSVRDTLSARITQAYAGNMSCWSSRSGRGVPVVQMEKCANPAFPEVEGELVRGYAASRASMLYSWPAISCTSARICTSGWLEDIQGLPFQASAASALSIYIQRLAATYRTGCWRQR